jgi:hypothetical protein
MSNVVAVHQIVELLKVAGEELAYCSFILNFPKENNYKNFDVNDRAAIFYKTVGNVCFHDALLIIASLLDRDSRIISFWNWQEFVDKKRPELEDIALRFNNSPLLMIRDQMSAHVDHGNRGNNFPYSKRRGLINFRLVESLGDYLKELHVLFHEYTRDTGQPWASTIFDTAESLEEIDSVMKMARPALTNADII